MESTNNQKAKLVVVDEHSLGYINPLRPKTVVILAPSVIRGSSYHYGQVISIFHNTKIRLASVQDFKTYRVDAEQYTKRPDEYEFQKD